MKFILTIFIKFLFLLTLLQSYSPAVAQATKFTSSNKDKINLGNTEKIFVSEIQISGSKVFSKAEIDSLIYPFLQKNISYEKLKEITRKITNLYVENGYVTSGAFLPEQEIVDGIIKIRIVEGKLEHIDIKGLKKLKEKYILARLQSNSHSPLNIERIQEKIQLLQQDQLIKQIDAKLLPGKGLGKSRLLLEVQEESQWAANIIGNNFNSANSGELQGIAIVANNNLLGFRDQLELGYSLTEGFDSLSFDYAFPLNAQGSKIRARYVDGDSEITSSDFSDFGIRADASTLSLQFEQSVVRDLNRDVAFSIAIDKRDSNTFIEDDLPFSFVEGAEEGRSEITALRIGGSWTERSKTTVISVNNRFNIGLDLFDPTINESDLDGIFFSWLGQVQFIQALNKKQDTLLSTRLTTQLTPDSLLPLEQISIGGANTVRGYRENRGVGDNGIFGTVEAQFPLLQDSGVGNINLVPFFDAGATWNNEGDEAETLASLGLGLDWEIKEWLTIEFDGGIPLISTSDLDSSLQDSGLHFQFLLKPLN